MKRKWTDTAGALIIAATFALVVICASFATSGDKEPTYTIKVYNDSFQVFTYHPGSWGQLYVRDSLDIMTRKHHIKITKL